MSLLNFFKRFSLSSCPKVHQTWQWFHGYCLWLCLRIYLYMNIKLSKEVTDFSTGATSPTKPATDSSLKPNPRKRVCLMTDYVFIWITEENRTPGKTIHKNCKWWLELDIFTWSLTKIQVKCILKTWGKKLLQGITGPKIYSLSTAAREWMDNKQKAKSLFSD